TNAAALISAKAQLEVRQFARTSLAARLIDPTSIAAPTNPACCVQLRAPVTGRILKIIQDSEAVVQAATPLVDIGDPLDLEVVADLLSTDAVQIKVGRRCGSTVGVARPCRGAWSALILQASS